VYRVAADGSGSQAVLTIRIELLVVVGSGSLRRAGLGAGFEAAAIRGSVEPF